MIPECCDPLAPMELCCVCGAVVYTCERKEPEDPNEVIVDYTCPVHPDGCQLHDGRWVCSTECWEKATEETE